MFKANFVLELLSLTSKEDLLGDNLKFMYFSVTLRTMAVFFLHIMNTPFAYAPSAFLNPTILTYSNLLQNYYYYYIRLWLLAPQNCYYYNNWLLMGFMLGPVCT